MAEDEDSEARLNRLLESDRCYPRDAYTFLLSGLARAQRDGPAGDPREGRGHVRGHELLEALREQALDEFGPLAFRVLAEWNIHRTEDFGRMVFNLIQADVLSAAEADAPADFADGYAFASAFVDPFVEEGDMPADLPPIN